MPIETLGKHDDESKKPHSSNKEHTTHPHPHEETEKLDPTVDILKKESQINADKHKDIKKTFTEDDLLAKEKKAEPKAKKPETVSVYISSHGIETHNKVGSSKGAKFVKLNVNGREFDVECDKQVEIPVEFYGGVQGLLEKQASGG